jgi:hypothetical protein
MPFGETNYLENINENISNIEELLTKLKDELTNDSVAINHWLDNKIYDDDDINETNEIQQNLTMNNFCNYISRANNNHDRSEIFDKVMEYVTCIYDIYEEEFADDLSNILLNSNHWTLITSELNKLEENIKLLLSTINTRPPSISNIEP